jgi:hypothetical protein
MSEPMESDDGWKIDPKYQPKYEKHTYSDDDLAELYNDDVDKVSNRPYNLEPTALAYSPNFDGEERVTDPDTGGMKNRKDCELFTAPPYGLEEYGKVCSYGSRDKYAQNNWRYGFVWSLSANALLRHYLAWVGGEDLDPDSGLHHLAHAAWHSLVLVQFSKDHPEKDDRFQGPAHPHSAGD